ncbi:MAG TPA: hypothetical protein DEV81_19010 [Cyanobacteria bacterium UBA11049]|nr:hypothetical protein [Cyanobacteria bacterium UBA11049]
MTDRSTNQPSNKENQEDTGHHQPQDVGDRSTDSPETVDVMDLVYKGGFDRDPQEILGNPGVAPEMLQEGRDLRVDLFRESEEADPNKKDDF